MVTSYLKSSHGLFKVMDFSKPLTHYCNIGGISEVKQALNITSLNFWLKNVSPKVVKNVMKISDLLSYLLSLKQKHEFKNYF